MSELKKIRDLMDKKFNELRTELQNSCAHEKISDWMEVHWAPGHGTGKLVKQCNRCGKQMEEARGRVRFKPGDDGKIETETVFYEDEEDV